MSNSANTVLTKLQQNKQNTKTALVIVSGLGPTWVEGIAFIYLNDIFTMVTFKLLKVQYGTFHIFAEEKVKRQRVCSI